MSDAKRKSLRVTGQVTDFRWPVLNYVARVATTWERSVPMLWDYCQQTYRRTP